MIDRLQLFINTILTLLILIGTTTLIFYLTKPSKRKFNKIKENE